MNANELRELKPILDAFAAGVTIQHCVGNKIINPNQEWKDIDPDANLAFELGAGKYRIHPDLIAASHAVRTPEIDNLRKWQAMLREPWEAALNQMAALDNDFAKAINEAQDMPPIGRIRELAYECGYAISVHGSEVRDYDLVASPWVTTARGNADLVAHLCQGLDAVRIEGPFHKAHGRVCVILQMVGKKNIDLSIMPLTPMENE